MSDLEKERNYPRVTGEMRLPEDLIARMIRVDHAGEYGAIRIYEGQLAVLKAHPAGDVIREMAATETEHLATFARLMRARRVRPTALSPVWTVAGYALGVATALLGPKAAMAATEAVEEVIDEHYAGQAALLGDDEKELRDVIEKYRADEVAHRDTAISHGAREAPGHALLTAAIKAGSRMAIWLSERV